MSTPRTPRVKVAITGDIIGEGRARDSGYCMISEAVKAAYPDARKVSTDIQTIRFSDPKLGLRFVYLTPRVAQLALIQFDQGMTPEPFNIRLQNGQVVPMARPRSQRPAPTEEGRARSKKARETWKSSFSQARSGSAPERIGGSTPPVAPSRRRAFGLRAMVV